MLPAAAPPRMKMIPPSHGDVLHWKAAGDPSTPPLDSGDFQESMRW